MVEHTHFFEDVKRTAYLLTCVPVIELPNTPKALYELAASIVLEEAQDCPFVDAYRRLILPLQLAAERYRQAPGEIHDMVRGLFKDDVVKQLVSAVLFLLLSSLD